jgi:NAD(P)H-flavin reductase/2-polyprenyl-6-methoxyphenol hydroxylase-like FAD-dependent oxidoreductase/ferredoxin
MNSDAETAFSVTLRYADGALRTMEVAARQSVLDAAEAQAVPIVNECQSGICGTCIGHCTSGRYQLGRTEGLSELERQEGKVLTCQMRPLSDCEVELDYPVDANAAALAVGEAVVAGIDLVSPGTAVLRLDARSLQETLRYRPGQFAQLQVPGTDAWRNYSYASARPADGELEFLVRLLPAGAMSDYLRRRARPGDRVRIRGSKGSFHLRPLVRPLIMVAGGTGLSAILAMLEQAEEEACPHPIRVCYGVSRRADLCKVDELRDLAAGLADCRIDVIVSEPSSQWKGGVGLVTDLLDDLLAAGELHGGDIDVYACGPAPMIDAVRNWLPAHGLHQAGLFYEKFVASGGGTFIPEGRLCQDDLDFASLARRGRNTAVVIGGSIAGIPAAKVLAQRFSSVIVLEQDGAHSRSEARPGAAQAWHLHHLLIGGQRILESIFPGITDDMVKAGAFKVDTAHQYRIMLAGSWKKVFKCGLEIVCAGRPLLEWCLRRRLDGEERIDYRYDSRVVDLVYDAQRNRILGAAVANGDELEVIPAAFIVDASGKNSQVPELLERVGVGAPEVEHDYLYASYSTMQHRVPADKQWHDKVMVICYAHRPDQEHYAAQYYTDASRRTLSTSLVAYNCDRPPRNEREFLEFAKLMPSGVIRDAIMDLEPCSPVYNFRYPSMLRRRYEDRRDLPCGLVAVGDAYCSADPVSGAGMTKAMLELDALRTLLQKHDPASARLVRAYYRRASKVADRIWFVVREQNLRYAWIRDVERKRPFYFWALVWYIDRVLELLHDDPAVYHQWLAVTHFVAAPVSLASPRIAIRAIGKWLAAKLTAKPTLIERNFGERRRSQPRP